MTQSDRLDWHDGLAPGHERRDGELALGGIRASELAERYGTPLLVLDLDTLDAAIARFERACRPHGVEIAYAGKALLLVALARHLAGTSLLLDVCSLGELAAAERAGFASERMILHGCGKNDEELAAAAAGRVGTIVVDNLDELRRLAQLARPERPVEVLLRVNTGIEAHTHEFVRTGGDKTKFGMSGGEIGAAAALLAETPALRFTGVHSHIGSQIYEANAFAQNARALMETAAYVHARGLACARAVAGGGFGVRMHPDDSSALDLRASIDAIAAAAREGAARHAIPLPRLGIEPGRALVAHAGTSLYRVVAVKEQFGTPYVVADGGMADNPRPALYGAYHHPVLASRTGSAPRETVLCGRSCENDRIVTAPLPQDVRCGDLLAVCTTGAYTYSMASNYNRFARPAVVALRGGRDWPIARRESVEDVLRNDCDG